MLLVTTYKIPIAAPSVLRSVETKGSASELGPFVIMYYIQHKGRLTNISLSLVTLSSTQIGPLQKKKEFSVGSVMSPTTLLYE